MPRKSDSVPSVTISGGMPRRATSTAFSPPPATPASRVTAADAAIGSPQSREATPKMTAASPIIAPTDRSMPPVMMTGVSATASSPSSTLNRVTSKKFATVAKLGATAEKSAISASTASSRIHSLFGKNRFKFPLRPSPLALRP